MLKIPASLKRFTKYIEDIEDYRHQGKDGDGYWIHLKAGFINTDGSVHLIHEDNITQCVQKFAFVAKCECEECLKLIHGKKGGHHVLPEMHE